MIIKSLKLKNFKLFKDLDLSFDKINIIKGENYSGKSTILKGIIFGLHGEASGTTLQKLIRFDEKECSSSLDYLQFNEHYNITRKVPNDLQISLNDKIIQFNTPTLKQNYLNEQYKDYEFFKKYRLINKQSINLLDLAKDSRSISTLRKELMTFIENDFDRIRKNLLAQKLERERFSIDKKLYSHYLSVKRLELLNASLDEMKKDYIKFEKDKSIQQGIISQIKSEISSREKIIYYKQQEMKKVDEGICPVLKIKCEKIAPKNKSPNLDMIKEINIIKEEINTFKKQLESEEESVEYYDDTLSVLRNKENKAREYLMKLKGAFQFKDYKYTKADIVIYDESIKELDRFAGWYIQNWLDSLTFIINDMLSKINLSVSFSADKQFLTITEDNKELDYNDLSSGQQIFLSVIFKLAILLQNGINDGIVIIDEGINELKLNNVHKLIDILKSLPFQVFLIYQNIDEIDNAKQFIVVREKGISHVK